MGATRRQPAANTQPLPALTDARREAATKHPATCANIDASRVSPDDATPALLAHSPTLTPPSTGA